MRQLRFTPKAVQDLLEIFDYIADTSGSFETARKFVAEIELQCAKFARLSSLVGRPRPELRPDLRSAPFGNYIIFFRYPDEDSLEIVHLIEGHRDIPAMFAKDEDP